MITENLAAALKGLRDRSQASLLWVDAVCIDQSNVIEKGVQVGMMGEIYKAGLRTLVWLGEENEDTNAAINTIRRIASSAAEYGIDEVQHGDRKHIHYTQPEPAEQRALKKLVSTTNFQQLASIYERPWFTRLWIIQEVALAQSARLFYGKEDLDFKDFARQRPYWKD